MRIQGNLFVIKSKTLCLICFSTACLLLFARCRDGSRTKQPSVQSSDAALWIADVPISVSDLSQEFKLYLVQRGLEYPNSKREFERRINECIDEMTIARILDREGKLRNIKEQVSSSDVAEFSQEPIDFPKGFESLEKDRKAWRDRVRKQILTMDVASAISEELMAGFEVSDLDVKAEYESRKSELKVPVELEVRVIKCTKRELADELYGKLKNGWDFIKLAAQYSVVRGKGEKGEPYQKSIVDFPEEIQPELLALGNGKFSKVCEYAGNYSIYYLENKLPERILSLNEVQDTLRQEIISRERSRRYRAWLKEQVAAVKILKGTPIPYEGASQ
jgi:hypothetical protein